jgi:hypothetical protein
MALALDFGEATTGEPHTALPHDGVATLNLARLVRIPGHRQVRGEL